MIGTKTSLFFLIQGITICDVVNEQNIVYIKAGLTDGEFAAHEQVDINLFRISFS